MGFFDKIQETITTAADQTKAKVQDTQLGRERKKKLEALGQQVYDLYKSGQLSHQELLPACQDIEELDGRIAAASQQAPAAAPRGPAQAPPAAGGPPAPPAAGGGTPPPPPPPPP
ncbi:MAG: hypothetical protein MUP40_06450, partial [Actinobacteria bacterium]|nr:hypothetical protein [Actinomycetota bacterium]